MPHTRPALGAGPRPIQCGDSLQCGFDLARCGAASAAMNRNVQGRADVGFQVLEEWLDRLQQGLRSFLQRAPHSLEKLADFPLVVCLATPERERCPQRLTDFLQEFLECATRLGRSAMDVPALESLTCMMEHAGRFILRRPRPRCIAPGGELEPAPRWGAATQMLEELLVVREYR